MTRLGWAVAVASSLALAQGAPPAADVEQAWLDPAGRGALLVGNGSTLGAQGFRAGAAAMASVGPLRSASGATLLDSRLGVQVFGALGLFDWLELGAVLPVFVAQQGGAALPVAPAGLGNPWAQARVSLLGAEGPVQVAVALGVGVPVGTGAAQGNGGAEVASRLQVGHVFSAWQVAVELGYLSRAPVDYSALTGHAADRVGSQVWLAAMATGVATSGPRGEVALRGHLSPEGGQAGLEAQLGVRWPLGAVELFASAGPGFGGAPSTPQVRALLGFAFANVPLQPPACQEGREYALEACPLLDRDGDGVPNGRDGAPLAPEDRDGFADEDGVPDADNDADGTADGADRCPAVAGAAEHGGCPAPEAPSDPGAAPGADGG